MHLTTNSIQTNYYLIVVLRSIADTHVPFGLCAVHIHSNVWDGGGGLARAHYVFLLLWALRDFYRPYLSVLTAPLFS